MKLGAKLLILRMGRFCEYQFSPKSGGSNDFG